MEYKQKNKTKQTLQHHSSFSSESASEKLQVNPADQKRIELRQSMQPLLGTPVAIQRRTILPIFQATTLQRAEEYSLSSKQESVQRQIDDLGMLPKEVIGRALQRQLMAETPLPPIKNPRTVDDLVTVMRQRATELDGKSLGERDLMHFNTLQRHVAANINQAYRQDRQSSEARNTQYGEMLASLHDHPASQRVSTAVLGMIPRSDQPRLQRALDEALQRKQEQAEQDQKALELHALQKKKAELEEEQDKSVFERIQTKKGGGIQLSASVRKHLEQGLNQDLSKVRIHDDAEANKLAKSVNAIAFTTGQDIFFQSGKYDPNSQTGLELLAHEVTHTVQQSKGQVAKGIDPDAGLEQEAQNMGQKLASQPIQEEPTTIQLKGHASKKESEASSKISTLSSKLAIQRQYRGPIVAPVMVSQGTYLGGEGQKWADAGEAASYAVSVLPSRLKAQFKDMPQQLLDSSIQMLKDVTLTLAATTAIGAAIGAFFMGAGAAPGAAAGFEAGLLILSAWGLAGIAQVVHKQAEALGQHISEFIRLSASAKGNPAKIRQAGEALSKGLLIFCDAVMLAIAAVILKKGSTAFAGSKFGKQIATKTGKSPSATWLKARLRFQSAKDLIQTSVKKRSLATAKQKADPKWQKQYAEAKKQGLSEQQAQTSATIHLEAPKKSPRQPSTQLDEIYKHCEVANVELIGLVKELSNKLKVPYETREGLKGRARANQKVAKAEAKGGNASDLLDVAGARLLLEDLNGVYAALTYIRSKYKIVQIKDKFVAPEKSGYRDINMNVQMSNGYIVELRLEIKKMKARSAIDHKTLYAKRRDIEDRAEIEKRPLEKREEAEIQHILKEQNAGFKTVWDEILKENK